MPSRKPAPDLTRIILALGVTQIVAYGTLYYSFSILAPAVAASLETTLAALYGMFSIGLLLGGFAAPWLGRMMDRRGAPRLMALGSLLAALGLGALSLSPDMITFSILFCLLEVVSVLIMYSAAFASLARFNPVGARRSITHLTLIAGFASTIFWPLSGWMTADLGWRATYAIFAGLHLVIALPLHLWLTRQPAGAVDGAHLSQTPIRQLRDRDRLFAFWCVAVSFALSGALMSALNVHLVPVLQTMGLGAGAYYTSMLMGPAQVAVRLTDALFWRSLHPTAVALISTTALCLAVLLLVIGLPAQFAGAAFAVVFGAGQGLSTIVNGTLPLALFGAAGFGARLGRLAAIRMTLSAGAPFVFASALEFTSSTVTLAVVLAMGVAALAPLVLLHVRLHRA